MLAGFVEGGSEDSENDFALSAADEIEAAFLLDELELRRHLGKIPTLTNRGWGTRGEELACARLPG